MLEIIIFGYLTTLVSAQGGVDVVLSCSLVEESSGMRGMGGGALFTRTPATLVLKDLTVTPDLSLETFTPFNPPAIPDPDDIIFEVKVSSLEIPEAELLLHADCNEQEVTCEISCYFPHGSKEGTKTAYFIGSLHVEGAGPSFTLVLQTLTLEVDQPTLLQTKLELPLSQSGTLLTEAMFLVFSRSQSASASLGGEVLLNCGFRQQDHSPRQEVGLDWRVQHRGNGRKVLGMRAGQTETEEVQAVHVHVEREGSSVDTTLLVEEGNASLTLARVKVSDEGTYICTVSTNLFQAQQVIQLHVTQPPRVSLSEEKLVFRDESSQKLSCHCKHYYPLDVQIEWLSLSPTDTEPIILSDQVSLSSHQQYSDGTVSLSSHLTVHPSAFPPGTSITCLVSHSTLATPISVSLTVETPEPDSYWMILGFLFITVLFFYQVMS